MSDEPSKTGIISQLAKAFSPTKSVAKKSQPVKRFENYSEAFASPEARVIPPDFLCKVLAAALSALDSAEGVIQNNQNSLNEYTEIECKREYYLMKREFFIPKNNLFFN